MAKKKKITAGMLGGRKKKKTPEDIEKAVSQIHNKEVSTPEPKEPQIETPKPVTIPEKPEIVTEKKETPKKKSKKPDVRFSFNMSKDLHLKFKIHCLEKDSTMQDEILMMIQKIISKKR